MTIISRKTLLGCGVAVAALAMAGGALAQQRTFDLPSQDAVKAIPAFARQAGIQIVAPAGQLRGVRTPAVRGNLDTHQALAALLRGTGLEIASDNGSLITLRQAVSAPASTGARAEQPMASVEEVVVTASKREELLRDVPQSITAVTERRLDRLQAAEFQDYARLVPGLSLQQIAPGQTQVTLRGLSTLSAGSTVGIYVDETPYGSSSGLANGASATTDLNTFDLQRIEVLRGPQGTLYGASTLGGLLKFVTNAPDPGGFAAKVQTNAESVDGSFGWAAKGMVNLPIGDKAALRVTGLHNDNPGYIDDPTRGLKGINGSRVTGLRASLLVNPTDNLSVRLTAVGQNSNFDGSNDVDIVPDATGAPVVPFRPLYGDKQQSRDYDEYTRLRYRLYNSVLDWDLGWANLVSATSYDTFRQGGLTDLSLLFGVYETTFDRQEKFTQEVRLSSPADQRLEWLAGAYYTHETAQLGQDYFGVLSGTVRVHSAFEETAGFGTLTYHFTPQFDVAVGGRYARNEQSETESGTGIGAALASDNSSSQGVFLYSIAPRWKPNEQTTVYARIASGYRPGGPNLVALGNPTAAPATFDADTVTNYEAGVKTDLLDGRLSLDVSAFDVKWDKIQLLAVINSTTVILNGGAAESKGVEWSATLRPVDHLSLAFSGAYTDATLTEGTAPPPPDPDVLHGRKGDPLPYQPKWSWTADANYEWPVFDTAQAFVGGSVSYVGERSTSFGEAFGQLRLDGYTTVDLRAGLELSRWTIELYAKNVGDVRAISQLSSNASTGGGGDVSTGAFGQSITIVQPRTIGLSVTGRF